MFVGRLPVRSLRFSPPLPTSKRPDTLDHGEQKGGGQAEEQHPVQCFESTHQAPVRLQVQVGVAVGGHRAQRVAPSPSSGRAPRNRYAAPQMPPSIPWEQGGQQGCDAHDHGTCARNRGALDRTAQDMDDSFVDKPETTYMHDHRQHD